MNDYTTDDKELVLPVTEGEGEAAQPEAPTEVSDIPASA